MQQCLYGLLQSATHPLQFPMSKQWELNEQQTSSAFLPAQFQHLACLHEFTLLECPQTLW